MNNIIDLDKERILRVIDSQTNGEINKYNSNVSQALEDCIQRNKIYDSWEKAKYNKLLEQGTEPCPCFNNVCINHSSKAEEIDDNRNNYCLDGFRCHGCLYQMLDYPPNSLNYNDYMPTHKEALDMLELHELLKGEREEYKQANCSYGKAKSRSERNSTEIKGIDFNILYETIETTIQDLIDNQFVKDEERIGLEQYKDVIARNAGIEVEKAMGIYPNITLV